MSVSSTKNEQQVYENARVLIALRDCIKDLQRFYKTLDNSDSPLFIPNKPHPRYFPYPVSFPAENGTSTCFRYLKFLEDDPACVTYLAEVTNENGASCKPYPVVVKFVKSYGIDVHDYLARKGWAPNLRYCGHFQKTRPSDDFPELTQRGPPGLRLDSNGMLMVVMEYIDAHPPPEDAFEQIKKVLTLLHTNGYVFGDLRPSNVLFDVNRKVKFINFDWCGRYDMKIRDENLPDGLQEQTICGPGMESLRQIRPKHDWMMFERLQWKST